MFTIPNTLLTDIVTAAPAAIGEIAYSLAVDRWKLARHSVLDSIRPEMTQVGTPPVLARAVEHVPDELSPDMPTVVSYASPDDSFTITFVQFPGESEIDAYVAVGNQVLHTRNVGSRAFDLFDPTK